MVVYPSIFFKFVIWAVCGMVGGVKYFRCGRDSVFNYNGWNLTFMCSMRFGQLLSVLKSNLTNLNFVLLFLSFFGELFEIAFGCGWIAWVLVLGALIGGQTFEGLYRLFYTGSYCGCGVIVLIMYFQCICSISCNFVFGVFVLFGWREGHLSLAGCSFESLNGGIFYAICLSFY